MSVSKYLSPSLAIGAVVATAHVAAAAQNGSQAPGPPALGFADCKAARLCALITPGTPPFVDVIHSKNVAAVRHPSTGLYCIKPKDTIVNVSRIIPSVTVEWDHSSGSDLLAFYSFGGEGCPANRITVLTYDLAQNRTDRVAFTIVVD